LKVDERLAELTFEHAQLEKQWQLEAGAPIELTYLKSGNRFWAEPSILRTESKAETLEKTAWEHAIKEHLCALS
jgi:hypothetical protein